MAAGSPMCAVLAGEAECAGEASDDAQRKHWERAGPSRMKSCVCTPQLVADAHAPNPPCEGNHAGEHGDDAEEGHWAEESGLAYARGGSDDGEELGYAQDQDEEGDLAAKILLKGEAGSGKSVALAALAHAMRKHGAVVCCVPPNPYPVHIRGR